MTKLKLKHDKTSAPAGVAQWNLPAIDKMQELTREAISEAMHVAMKEYECHAWFPAEYAPGNGLWGKAPEDPTTIFVELPLGQYDDENPRWSFTLNELIDRMVDDWGNALEDNDKEKIRPIRHALQGLVTKLDEALERKRDP